MVDTCNDCNDTGQKAVQNTSGEWEIEECLCIAELSFFELHGIGEEE
tara:strand:- start:2543 stop:2683 length:141 start_codon:yes stop_codon:yes gene_type:complete